MLTIVAELGLTEETMTCSIALLFSGTACSVVTRGSAALFGANNRRTHAAEQRTGGVLYKSCESTFNELITQQSRVHTGATLPTSTQNKREKIRSGVMSLAHSYCLFESRWGVGHTAVKQELQQTEPTASLHTGCTERPTQQCRQ